MPNPSTGQFYTGTLTVYDSPQTALWTVVINGQTIDATTGLASIAGIQIGSSDELVIQSSALAAYVGTTFHATLSCVATSAGDTDLIIPGHDTLINGLIESSPSVVVLGTLNTNAGSGLHTLSVVLPNPLYMWLGVTVETGGFNPMPNPTDVVNVDSGSFGIISNDAEIAETEWYQGQLPPIPSRLGGIDPVIMQYTNNGPSPKWVTLFASTEPLLPVANADADTAVSKVNSVANTNTVLTPAPTTGLLTRVGTITFYNATGAAGTLSITGVTSGNIYVFLPYAISPAGLIIPFDVQANESLQCASSTVATRVTTYYRTVPQVPYGLGV